MKNSNNNKSSSWLKQASTTTEDVEFYYDAWAKKYNKDLKNWEYHAPVEAAKLLKQYIPESAKILDAGFGVLTYIEDPKSLFREFCRIVRPGGYIIFTHREDLIKSFNYPEILKELEQQNYWKNLNISEPKLYLPKNKDFTDEIKVVYYTFQASGVSMQ